MSVFIFIAVVNSMDVNSQGLAFVNDLTDSILASKSVEKKKDWKLNNEQQIFFFYKKIEPVRLQ